MHERLRKLTDLFVRGGVVVLEGAPLIWVQVINSFERDDCLSAAQAARARLTLALKSDPDERAKISSRIRERGADVVKKEIAEARADEKNSEFTAAIMDDPDWKERIDVVLRTDPDDLAKPLEPAEVRLIDQINEDFQAEVARRRKDELEYQERRLSVIEGEDLVDEYMDQWLKVRGAEAARAEYELSEIALAARWCDGQVDPGTGRYTHETCDGHEDRVFSSRAEVKTAPDELVDAIKASLQEVAMAGRDPKGSASPESSSRSAASPSAEEGSTPSSSDATPAKAPGTSRRRSRTP